MSRKGSCGRGPLVINGQAGPAGTLQVPVLRGDEHCQPGTSSSFPTIARRPGTNERDQDPKDRPSPPRKMGGFPEGDAELLRQRRQRFLEKEQKLREEKDEHQANLYSALAELRNVIAEDMVETEEPEFFEDIQAEWDAFTKEVQEDDSAGISRNMPRGQAQQAKKGPTTGPRRQDPGGNLGVEREPVLVPDSTWADDSAFPLRDDNPKLLATAEFAAPLDLSPHELPGAGNDPNLKPSKAAPVLRFAGKGAQAARRCFLADAKPQLWRLPDTQVSISTTPAYTHVGGVLDHRASMLPEARRRLSIASTSTSYDEGKALLYGNNTIALPVRVAVFEAAIRPSCFNVALWLPVGEALFKLPSSVVHALTARPPGLWAMLQLEQTWCQAVQKDLAWLRDREVAGTICQACGKQFWAENKLAIHLRASAECVTKSCEPFQKALDHYHYPLYDQEVIEIVQHATKEIQHVKDAGLNWSPTQYEAALSYEDFNEAFGNVGWTELQDKIRDTHGTVAAPLQALIKPRTNL
ncbi:hypothetical protein AK812_SmicGene15130 [Symbiodinium microadriaticum]|uniref:C2H2-type domain-containing protein n=1 Tax=Symbiodinium microadriaticum TaxID=2951 RepID=A0A1Q9E3V0_SYMMI|nr:hypothetical protein AK812_SmicGene15130 [Symbiodinium microadriaticum]